MPAWNVSVEREAVYFVRGADRHAYLVGNSSHGCKAFATLAYFAPTLRRGARPRPIKIIDPFRMGDDQVRTGLGWLK
jgi:hypothetical protein